MAIHSHKYDNASRLHIQSYSSLSIVLYAMTITQPSRQEDGQLFLLRPGTRTERLFWKNTRKWNNRTSVYYLFVLLKTLWKYMRYVSKKKSWKNKHGTLHYNVNKVAIPGNYFLRFENLTYITHKVVYTQNTFAYGNSRIHTAITESISRTLRRSPIVLLLQSCL